MRSVDWRSRRTALIGLIGLIAALLLVGSGTAEGAWWPKRKLALKRIAAADQVAPTKPRGLKVASTTASSVTVSWQRSTDRVGVAGYIVYRDGVRIGSTAATKTRYVASTLTCGTSHRIAVQAYDRAGNRSARAVILAATSACVDTQAPSVPANVAQTGVTSSSITISWSASTDNFGVVGYEVLSDGALAGSTASTLFALTGASLRCRCTPSAFGLSTRPVIARMRPASWSRRPGAPIRQPHPRPRRSGCLRSTRPPISVRWSAASDDRGVARIRRVSRQRAGRFDGATSYTIGSLGVRSQLCDRRRCLRRGREPFGSVVDHRHDERVSGAAARPAAGHHPAQHSVRTDCDAARPAPRSLFAGLLRRTTRA